MVRTMPNSGILALSVDVAFQRERYASVMVRIATLSPMHAMLIFFSAAKSAVSGLLVPYQRGGWGLWNGDSEIGTLSSLK